MSLTFALLRASSFLIFSSGLPQSSLSLLPSASLLSEQMFPDHMWAVLPTSVRNCYYKFIYLESKNNHNNNILKDLSIPKIVHAQNKILLYRSVTYVRITGEQRKYHTLGVDRIYNIVLCFLKFRPLQPL